MSDPAARATHIRFLVIVVAMFASLLLYLERVCLSVADVYVREDLKITKADMDLAFGAFFIAYALGQVPSGWLSQRYGPRLMMTLYMLGWSVFGCFIALAQDFTTLFLARFLLGLSQAGAYPTAVLLVKRWVPDRSRGLASSVVAFGGRFGGAGATWLTGLLIVAFVPADKPATVELGDIRNPLALGTGLCAPSKPGPLDPIRDTIREQAVAVPTSEQLASASIGGSPAVLFFVPPERIQSLVNDAVHSRNLVPIPTDRSESQLHTLLAADGKAILDQAPATWTQQQSERLYRLLIEKTFPDGIRQLHGEGWRPTLMLYGVLGIGVGGLFWVLTRDRPRQHPWANAAEVELIESGQAKTPDAAATGIPWKALASSRNQWFFSANQFFSNVGWVFLITLLPRFLDERFGVPVDQRGKMNTVVLFIAAFGTIGGGWLTDFLTRRHGKRIGRSVPAGVVKIPCALALLAVPWLPDVWTVVFALAFMAVCQDAGIPSAWAFAQDTGGDQAATVIGWANMWGNFGAAFATPILGLLGAKLGWDFVMFTGAFAFVMSGTFGMLMNATVPLFPKSATEPAG